MRGFFEKFIYLLDHEDRKKFIHFLILLFIGGLLSLLGIGAVVPFIDILTNHSHLKEVPLIRHFSYKVAVGFCVGLLILAFWIKNGASVIVLKRQAKFLSELTAKVQKRLFHCYIYSPYVFHTKRSSPELVNNINIEINFLSNGLIGPLGNLLNEGVTSGVVFIALLFINPVFTSVIVGSILLAGKLFFTKLRAKVYFFSELRTKNYVELARCVLQGLGGIKETKIYQKESFFTAQVSRYADGIAAATTFASIFSQSIRFVIEVIAISVVLILMFVFVVAGYTGQQLLVLISVFGVAAVQLLPSMNRLMIALTSVKYYHVTLGKIYGELRQYDCFKQNAELKTNLKEHSLLPFNQTINLRDISFSYGAVLILDAVTLTIPKGKKVAFVGYSGAGKTTLVDIVLGILAPMKGEMSIDGIKISEENLPYWQRHFGYIPQVIYIYDCSLRENIAFGLAREDIDDSQVWDVLNQASLSDFVKNQCPAGLDTLVGENGIRLSGGQRQRIGIARALFHNPDVLVMDEATAALDNQTEYEVTQALDRVEKNRTIITIAHRLTTVRNYDMIYVMDKGRIVSSGSYSLLLKNCVVFNEMVNVTERGHVFDEQKKD